MHFYEWRPIFDHLVFSCCLMILFLLMIIVLQPHTGPIKEKDGRVRHIKGVGEKVKAQETLGKHNKEKHYLYQTSI